MTETRRERGNKKTKSSAGPRHTCSKHQSCPRHKFYREPALVRRSSTPTELREDGAAKEEKEACMALWSPALANLV